LPRAHTLLAYFSACVVAVLPRPQRTHTLEPRKSLQVTSNTCN